MTKVQYAILLRLRGIQSLDEGESAFDAMMRSGGQPSPVEMADVNKEAMMHYYTRVVDLQDEVHILRARASELTKKLSYYTHIIER